jgi:lipopolysaccharide cholinephosphotransferase
MRRKVEKPSELNRAELCQAQLRSAGVAMHVLTMGELRSAQLHILRKIAEFCDTQDIRYYLFAGTLLGAVRHHGYIPWDDDIDIMMPRPDFERFCREFAAAPGDADFSLYSRKTCPDFPYPFAKVGSDRTLLVENWATSVPIGVNIDVFPLDGWPDGLMSVWIHRWRIRFYRSLLGVKAARPRRGRPWPKSVLLMVLRPIAQRTSVTSLVDRIVRRATRFPFDTSEHAGVTVWAYQERLPREAYGLPAEVDFEELTWPAPTDYDLVLRALYGDYMRLPASAERRSLHSFTAFRLATPKTNE